MRIGKYETGILKALKDRTVPPGSKHPKRAFWWPAEGWITNPIDIENAIRLDSNLGIVTTQREELKEKIHAAITKCNRNFDQTGYYDAESMLSEILDLVDNYMGKTDDK